MASTKPRIVIFSCIPRVGEIIKKMLPSENIKIVQYPDIKTFGAVTEDHIVQMQDAEILLSENMSFAKMTDRFSCLKWYQGSWAGVEDVVDHFRGKAAPAYRMTRMSSEPFNQQMAEYVVGQMIMRERDFRHADKQQADCVWAEHGAIRDYRSLRSLTVGVLGTGQVGMEICRALKAFRCRVLGYARSPRDPAQWQHVMDQYYSGGSLPDVLSVSDYVVACLPNTPHTAGFLSAAILQQFKPGSVLINLGRGNLVSEEDLVTALDTGPLAGAILDVFETEPLPATSKLWTHPKVVITPHCAGVSRPQDVAEVFVENYNRFINSEPLHHEIDLQRGY